MMKKPFLKLIQFMCQAWKIMIKLREDKKFTENLELESFLFSKLWYNKTSSFTKGEDEDYEKS